MYLVAFVHKNEEEVKSGHDGCCHVDVLFQRFRPVVATTDWICSSQNRSPSI